MMAEVATLSSSAQREIVSFRVAEQDYCIDIDAVREIRGWTPTTILPHSPTYIRGVMNLRGTVLPVVDLSERLGLGATEPNPRHVIIITMIGARMVGLLVDAVNDILNVNLDDFQPTPEVVSGTAKTFVEAVIAIDERLLRLIELDRIIANGDGL